MRFLKTVSYVAMLIVAAACGCSGNADAPPSSAAKRETSSSSTDKGQSSSNSTDKGQVSLPSTDKRPTSPNPVVSAVITVTAEQLANDYKADSTAADRKYLEKLVAVEGLIQSLNSDFETTPAVIIEGVPAEQSPIHIYCAFAENELPRIRATKFQSGQRISVKGTVARFSDFVIVGNCRLVSLSESPERLTSDALAKEIDNASKGIKFARLDFRLDETPMTIEAPEGATAKAETLKTTITWGDRFAMSIELGREVHYQQYVLHNGDRPIVNDPDLFFSKESWGGFFFATALERGHQDFSMMPIAVVGGKVVSRSRDDCLLMLKCSHAGVKDTADSGAQGRALQRSVPR